MDFPSESVVQIGIYYWFRDVGRLAMTGRDLIGKESGVYVQNKESKAGETGAVLIVCAHMRVL